MGLFDDNSNTFQHCQSCDGEFPEDEMANDETCKNCEFSHGQEKGSFFEKNLGESVGMEADDYDPDFEGMYMDDDMEMLPEGDEVCDEEVEEAEACGEDKDALEEGTQFDKFMDKIVLHETRKQRKEVIADSPAVRYNKRYNEFAKNRITYKK